MKAHSLDGNGSGLNGHPRLPEALADGDGSGGGGRPVVITGGAGFIGANLAHRLLSRGERVLVYDNLSRPGVEANLAWLRKNHGGRLEVTLADIRDSSVLSPVLERACAVFHFAAQVAVTSSISQPLHDFEINARGTLAVLEILRGLHRPPPLFFTSTNKVYGNLGAIPVRLGSSRYEPVEETVRERGVGEMEPLDFRSPYGCSKGAADQYVLDYAQTFGLRAVVFRMSCIYGPHQCGTEDQGWVAHFLMQAGKGRPIVVYGDGRQVRDVLFIEDLLDAFQLARQHVETISGQAFNIGGGPANAVSLLELLDLIGGITGRKPCTGFSQWRQGDQRYYVSDTSRFGAATGWRPKIPVQTGIGRLHAWINETTARQSAPPASIAR